MKAIGYARVSTEEQVREGVSLDAQEERIRAYCKAKDWELIEPIVRDEGLSGKNLKRPGIQGILQRIPKRNGTRGFDSIVVVKLDRLTRSVGDLAYLTELFEAHKVSFVSIQESVDTSTASGRMFHNIIAVLSQWQREVISENTKDALRYKRQNGELAGEVPYGYQAIWKGKTREIISKGQKVILNIKDLEPIREEQMVLRKIQSLRESSLSYQKIADRLNGEGIPTKKGRSKWFAMSVRSVLLHNRELKGVNV